MRLVIVESPYAGDLKRNREYARAALADCIRRGEAPFASHLLYTQPGVLRDEEPTERLRGILAGLAWGRVADATVVYVDLGVSKGMEMGIQAAVDAGRLVENRSLPLWAPVVPLTALERALEAQEPSR
jgi:predicted phosphoribosyltransferase